MNLVKFCMYKDFQLRYVNKKCDTIDLEIVSYYWYVRHKYEHYLFSINTNYLTFDVFDRPLRIKILKEFYTRYNFNRV